MGLLEPNCCVAPEPTVVAPAEPNGAVTPEPSHAEEPNYMDPALWMTMPMHIVEVILSKVPFRNLVAMRRVCKHWNSLILSEGFSPPFVPALIMFARTPTVRKMMWERNQPILKVNDRRRGAIIRIWRTARRFFKRKPPVTV